MIGRFKDCLKHCNNAIDIEIETFIKERDWSVPSTFDVDSSSRFSFRARTQTDRQTHKVTDVTDHHISCVSASLLPAWDDKRQKNRCVGMDVKIHVLLSQGLRKDISSSS